MHYRYLFFAGLRPADPAGALAGPGPRLILLIGVPIGGQVQEPLTAHLQDLRSLATTHRAYRPPRTLASLGRGYSLRRSSIRYGLDFSTPAGGCRLHASGLWPFVLATLRR